MSPIEIGLPSAICIDFDNDFDLDYPKYGKTILERFTPKPLK